MKKLLKHVFIVSLMTYVTIFVIEIATRKKSVAIKDFFIKKVKSREIVIQNSFTQKIKLMCVVLVLILSIISQILSTQVLISRSFLLTYIYIYTLQYVLSVKII